MKWAIKALIQVESSVLIMITKTEQISLNDNSSIKYLLDSITKTEQILLNDNSLIKYLPDSI